VVTVPIVARTIRSSISVVLIAGGGGSDLRFGMFRGGSDLHKRLVNSLLEVSPVVELTL
jgi:hypothetical protein